MLGNMVVSLYTHPSFFPSTPMDTYLNKKIIFQTTSYNKRLCNAYFDGKIDLKRGGI
jgi:hypothetical protein